MRQRYDSLIGQVVAANVVLVTLTVLAAALVGGFGSIAEGGGQLGILVLVIVLTFCVNLWMLQRRFAPLEELIDRVEGIDPAEPATFEIADGHPVEEIDRLAKSFRRILQRVDDERRRSSKLVVRAQEEERRRLARDLHDEVNQALTAILLRLEAPSHDLPPQRAADVAQLKGLATRAMDELLGLARQLRPSALDDHGLVPAIEAQLRAFTELTGVDAHLEASGEPEHLDDERQTVLYRVTQEALTNAGRHAGAHHVDVVIAFSGDGAELQVRDDGIGFDPVAARFGGLGLEGMAERARIVGGELDLRSSPGSGTELTLRVP